MQPSMIWANMGVEDLERTSDFYTKLGFTSNGRSDELTSFLFGEKGFVIHFFLKEVLASNVKTGLADLKNGNEIVFTLWADSRDTVDQWQKEVEAAGGTVITPAEAFGPGYYGFLFADPDGHKFNVFNM